MHAFMTGVERLEQLREIQLIHHCWERKKGKLNQKKGDNSDVAETPPLAKKKKPSKKKDK